MALQTGRGAPQYQPFPQQGGTMPFQDQPQQGMPPGAQTLAGLNPQPQGGGGGLPPWVTPEQAQFYQTLNAGWKQGHGGQDIPQERFQYLQKSYNDEAAQGANGSHVGDMGWWQNRSAIDRGPDPGEPGYVPGSGNSGGGGGFGGSGGGGMAPGYSTTPMGPNAPFTAPGLAAPYNKEFQPTDINSILNSDAFKAAQANGVDQIQRSAAGRGTLLTGGTLKDLSQWNQGLALGTLNDQFNRDATTFGTNRDTFWGNQDRTFNKLNQFAQTGMQGAQQLGGYGSQYGNSTQNNTNQQTGLMTGQANATAGSGMLQANNTNQTLGGLADSAGAVDWMKKLQPGRGRLVG